MRLTAILEEFWSMATRRTVVVNDDDAEPRGEQLQHGVAADVPPGPDDLFAAPFTTITRVDLLGERARERMARGMRWE
jgi:hypothetical protein